MTWRGLTDVITGWDWGIGTAERTRKDLRGPA
jgi:hypothetical protein